jgi:hypothetical protein
MTTGHKIAVSWIELVLMILLTIVGMSFWVIAEPRVRTWMAGSEPQVEEFAEKRGVPGAQRRSSLAEAEWKADIALLVEQRLEILRQGAKLLALERSYPRLHGVLATPPTNAVPAEAVKEYRDAQRQLRTATELAERLEASLGEVGNRLDQSATAMRLTRRSAARDWRDAKTRGERLRQGWTFLWAAGGSCLVLLLTFLTLSGSTARRLGIKRWLVVGSTAALLSILYGYQFGHGLSLAVASALLLVGLWLFLHTFFTNSNATGGTP